jgi:hypothetical protein
MADPSFAVHPDGRVTFRFKNFETGAPFIVEILCPIPSQPHQEQARLRELHRAWARKFDLMPDPESFARYCATRFDMLIGYQYHGWSLEAAAVASHLMTWFFVFDDNMDMDHDLDPDGKHYTAALARRHLDLLEGDRAREGDPGVILAFDDFLRQVRELAGDRHQFWYRRMVYHLREYVYGTLWESAIGPTTAARANTAMYMQVRHMAVGVAPCHELMAIASAIDPRPIEHEFFLRRIERLAINYSIWINDLAGLNRDQKRGLANVIFTIQKDHSLSLEEAARMVGRMCDGELEAFFQLERQMPILLEATWERDRRSLLAYNDVLRRWMRGLLDWSARSDRYQCLSVDMSLQSEATIREATSKYLAQGSHPRA